MQAGNLDAVCTTDGAAISMPTDVIIGPYRRFWPDPVSSFLQRQPRRLPVALAEYLAATRDGDWQRRAIGKQIFSALTAEEQAETARMCGAVCADTSNQDLQPNSQRFG